MMNREINSIQYCISLFLCKSYHWKVFLFGIKNTLYIICNEKEDNENANETIMLEQ